MGGRGRGRDGEGREAVKLEKMRGGGTAGGAAEIAAPRNSPPLYGANCIKVRWERPERGGSEARQLLDVVRLALLRWRASDASFPPSSHRCDTTEPALLAVA